MRSLRIFYGAKLQKINLISACLRSFTLLRLKECVAWGCFFINIEIYFKKIAHMVHPMDIVRIFVINDVECVLAS